jgi:DNA-binding transcriptional MerR regulator
VNGIQLGEHLNVSYRRVDYWSRAGFIRPLNPDCGSGFAREYPPDEVEVARRLLALATAGVIVPVAAQIARGDSVAIRMLSEALLPIVEAA